MNPTVNFGNKFGSKLQDVIPSDCGPAFCGIRLSFLLYFVYKKQVSRIKKNFIGLEFEINSMRKHDLIFATLKQQFNHGNRQRI